MINLRKIIQHFKKGCYNVAPPTSQLRIELMKINKCLDSAINYSQIQSCEKMANLLLLKYNNHDSIVDLVENIKKNIISKGCNYEHI